MHHSRWIALILLCAVIQGTGSISAQVQADRDPAILYVPLPLEPVLVQEGRAAPDISDAVWQRAIATHIPLITVKSRLNAVCADANGPIARTRWYSQFRTRSDAVNGLAANLHAVQVPGTALIEVWLNGDVDPKERAEIVTQIVNHYLEENHSQRTGKLVDQVTLLTNLKARWESQIKDSRLRIAKLTARLPATQPTKPEDIIDARAMEAERQQMIEEEKSLQEQWRRVRDQLDRLNVMMTQSDGNSIGYAARPVGAIAQ